MSNDFYDKIAREQLEQLAYESSYDYKLIKHFRGVVGDEKYEFYVGSDNFNTLKSIASVLAGGMRTYDLLIVDKQCNVLCRFPAAEFHC